MLQTRRRLALLAAAAAFAFHTGAGAKELLRGEFTDLEGDRQPFVVDAQDRKDIVGGTISLGGARYTIAKQSRLGLIGAARFSRGSGDEEFGEYVVLSSSFSDMTATGQPWVAARRYVGCDEEYNTFVAIYRVYGVEKVNALGSSPYGNFTDNVETADESVVYCLYSAPPAGEMSPGGATRS